ncbi:ABC transporter substrate-binding protein [Pseudaestuariivita atlantica]|uniref:ABC transporter substrate-binding protein n=1 Tax=Pseudaestuariivita atlantica TaxID=1317121 RepID=A0A0L1JLA3_9RHOB|nr:ABC transporter substrate-binding protein [Pseudaestuariivita atlantica]KNG92203.1 ABC transporter substrate-binding protein [Pseudaestuariivita atlantica]
MKSLAFAAALASAASWAIADPISFEDQRERTVTLDGEAERVVTIPIPAASMFIAVDGGTDRLVGMHQLSKTAIKGRILERFYPDALAIPSNITGKGFSFVPNVEELLALEPDLVFQWGHLNDDIIDPLVNAGLNVALIKIGQEAFTRKWLTIMGEVTGKPEKAKAMIDWRDDVMAELQAATAGIAEGDRPRTLYFMNYLSSLRVAGGKSYNNFYIDLAGGKNVASELGMFVEVGIEQIISWDPEVILLNGFEAKLSPKDVYDNPLLADVSAVKSRRVYKMPLGGYRWDPPNQESPLTWLWLSMVLHPDKFNWDMADRINRNYEFIYGQSVDADDVRNILRFDMNADAANYDIFADG